jgi:hypothetical protein
MTRRIIEVMPLQVYSNSYIGFVNLIFTVKLFGSSAVFVFVTSGPGAKTPDCTAAIRLIVHPVL